MDCYHESFKKHNGLDSHGLWPFCAMVCVDCRKIIGCRGTMMPAIGRGNGGRL